MNFKCLGNIFGSVFRVYTMKVRILRHSCLPHNKSVVFHCTQVFLERNPHDYFWHRVNGKLCKVKLQKLIPCFVLEIS